MRLRYLPTILSIAGAVLVLVLGPVAQPRQYNDFADRSVLLGIPHAADVLSSLGFALVAMWGWVRLYPQRHHAALRRGWCGYCVFLVGLLLAAAGSAYYHLAPDNQRLVWDRIPIAVVCAGLLAGVRAETKPHTNSSRFAVIVTVLAILSVAWWRFTDVARPPGDLGPYLYLQALPLLLIPLWQAANDAPQRDRLWFGTAIVLYVLAKFAELLDHELLRTLGWISGHTLKHLLASLAMAVVVGRLSHRVHLSTPLPEEE